MTLLTMSQQELDQVGIFEKLKEGSLSQEPAASALGLSVRQVRRKLKAYRKDEAPSLVHAGRGKPSNRQHEEEIKTKAAFLLAKKCADFGPTLAAEKLLELDELKVGKETVRKLMTEAGLWKPKAKRQGKAYEWRSRRPCFGELVQLDGSYHDWFEGRTEPCCLLAFIDDATGRILWLGFCDAESTESLMRASRGYLERDSRHISLYTDRGSVYKVNIHNADGEKKMQYERALRELSIEFIHARSPQAKGRIERLFKTLQDRLV